MSPEAPDLVITPAPGAAPVRARLTKVLTIIGSDERADVRIGTLPAQWAVVQVDGASLVVRRLGAPSAERLALGDRITIESVGLAAVARVTEHDARLPVSELAEALCGAESADDALRAMLRALLVAAQADVGAVVVSQKGTHVVAAVEARDGNPRPDGAELLSDTIVRDALESGRTVNVDDAGADARYAAVPSVVKLRLRTVMCAPMMLSGRVLGAIYLGRQGRANEFSTRAAEDLSTLAAMAVPLLVHLRRSDPLSGLAPDHIIGESADMQGIRRLVERIGPADLSVLVLGETGTGKEVVARSIHATSRRAGQRLVALNCAAVPEGLLAAELFGCKKGAFTGALADRKGCIEEAAGSTLFLDEVGDMPLAMQAALLRVLEQREVVRVGENVPRPVDFRLVSATHKDLSAEVAAGRFRGDLLFRLQEISIRLPPLASRGDDVQLLAQLFLRQAEAQFSLPVHMLTDEARNALRTHAWPGNVRELRATMRRAALLCTGMEIGASDLGLTPQNAQSGAYPVASSAVTPASDLGNMERPLSEARDEFVTRYVAAVLERHGGNREKAAAALGISVRSLYRLT